jgi:surface protein
MAVSTGKIYLGSTLVSGGGSEPAEWVRPSDWLPLPPVNISESKFVGLFAVLPEESPGVALSATGGFTVDWGDGVVESFSSDAIAEHTYDYASISNSTLCSRGYKQVIVTVTPSAGQTFSGINLQVRRTELNAVYNVPWLDITMGGPSLSDIRIAQNVLSPSGTKLVRLQWLEKLSVVQMTRTTLLFFCIDLFALESVSLPDTSNVTNFGSMFNACRSLRVAPFFDTSGGTNFSGMFSNCSALVKVPLYDTSNATTMASMFSTCTALKVVPQFNTPNVTSMSSIFSSCSSITEIPLLDTTKVTNMNAMVALCASLHKIPAIVANAVTSSTNFNTMFNGCSSLTRIEATGFRFTFSVAGANLSAAALNEIYNNLAVVSGQTITVTGNFGTNGHDPAIATAKGWTVTV